MNPPELNREIKVSIGLVVTLITISFSLGSMWTRISDLNDMILQEVGGLRADWERERTQQIKLNDKILKDIEALKDEH